MSDFTFSKLSANLNEFRIHYNITVLSGLRMCQGSFNFAKSHSEQAAEAAPEALPLAASAQRTTRSGLKQTSQTDKSLENLVIPTVDAAAEAFGLAPFLLALELVAWSCRGRGEGLGELA
jgi:hypothetical protein